VEFAEMADFFGMPARDRHQPRPTVHPPTRRQLLLRRTTRRVRARRLAYLDNTFPWAHSGFRYHEALALHALAPDTLFFSVWDLDDPFPVPVHPIAAFPELAVQHRITDAYGVFQLFLEGIAGTLGEVGPAELTHSFAGPDMSAALTQLGIRLHGTIYPGGGFVPTPEGLARLKLLATRLATTMSYVPEVLTHLPDAVAIDQALTETRFYGASSARWDTPSPLVCIFAADSPPRKGIDIALATFAELDPARFHLHVVGPHGEHRDKLPTTIATFHGWMTAEQLRELHRSAHVFLSPVRSEEPGPAGSYQGATDGFPTQSASDAMSSGCLLISSNPLGDHRVLDPGVHYVQLERDPELWRRTLQELAADPVRARTIAEAGSARVHERMDIRRGTARKLELMGIGS
jgi:glycosyltransferase involved in cell wall biosynthesis